MKPRLFASDAAVRRIGVEMVACRLPREEWTHEAHLAACAWIILEQPDIVPERDLPGLIRRYNESVGGVNDATQGYHETITQASIRGVRCALGRSPAASLVERVNFLLGEAEGNREWPLRFYSAERLFSVEARLGWIEPDLEAFPASGIDPATGVQHGRILNRVAPASPPGHSPRAA